jgi:hypothetical protein
MGWVFFFKPFDSIEQIYCEYISFIDDFITVKGKEVKLTKVSDLDH